MRNRTNLIIGVVLVVVAGFAYWLALNPEVAEEPEESALEEVTPIPGRSVLFEVAAEEIVEVEIRDVPGNRFLQLTLEEGEWRFTGLIEAEPEAALLELILQDLAAVPVERTLTETTSLQGFGVYTPTYVITVTPEGAAEPLIAQVGDEAPTTEAYYVYVRGDQHIVLVSKSSIDMIVSIFDAPTLLPES